MSRTLDISVSRSARASTGLFPKERTSWRIVATRGRGAVAPSFH
jgi:hypothetical protein